MFFLDIYHILVFSSLLLLANVSHKVVKDRLEPDKTTREVLLQKTSQQLGKEEGNYSEQEF